MYLLHELPLSQLLPHSPLTRGMCVLKVMSNTLKPRQHAAHSIQQPPENTDVLLNTRAAARILRPSCSHSLENTAEVGSELCKTVLLHMHSLLV